MKPGDSPSDRLARVGRYLMALLVVVSVLALGGLHTEVLAGLLIGAGVCTTVLYLSGPVAAPRPAAMLLVATALGLTSFTALQLVPLPLGVLQTLAPTTADVWATCLAPLREAGPSSATLSLDPNATRVEVARGLLYLLVFLGGLAVARRSEGVLFLERVLFAAAALLAVVTLMHPAFGADRVLGIYRPMQVPRTPEHTAPLLNANHLGGYLNIGIAMGMGILLSPRRSIPQYVVGAVLVLLLGAQVFVASRGALACALVAVVLAIVLYRGLRVRQSSSFPGRAVLAITFAAAATMVALATNEGAMGEIASRDTSKFDIFRRAIRLLRDHAAWGIGRGAFESVFAKERSGVGHFVFTHPENLMLQWATEWGVVVSMAGLVSIFWALRPKTVFARSHVPLGAFVALVALFLQNLVDFSSEAPGVVVPLCLCAAMITGGLSGDTAEATPSSGRWRRWLPLALPRVVGPLGLVLATGVALWALAGREGELFREQRSLQAQFAKDPGDPTLTNALRAAMLRHPAEPYFPFLGAYRAVVTRQESAVPWAARTLDRSPTHGRAHLMLAREFFSRNPSQARLEYRLAMQQDPGTFEGMRDEAPLLVTSYFDAMELVPDTDPLWTLELLSTRLHERLPATSARLDAQLLALSPQKLPALARVAADALTDLRDAPWCREGVARSACSDEAILQAEHLRDAQPANCDGHLAVAEARVLAGQTLRALVDLEKQIDNMTDRGRCLRGLADLASRTGDRARATTALNKLMDASCAKVEDCLENLLYVASTEEARHNPRRALTVLRRAADLAPERNGLLAEQARLASTLGLHSEAADLYDRLATREPEKAEWAEKRAAEKRAAAMRAIPIDALPADPNGVPSFRGPAGLPWDKP
jgi:hypothetical protein